MKTCTLSHDGDVPAKVIRDLPASQAGEHRHRCAACAYLAGKRDAQQSIANLRKRIRDLEDNSPADEP